MRVAHSIRDLRTGWREAAPTPSFRQSLKETMGSQSQLVRALRAGKKEVAFSDPEGRLAGIFLAEANHWLNKAIYAHLAYKHLQAGGFGSWAAATFYYSRFYVNCSLTRLQLAALTHLPGWRPTLLRKKEWSGGVYEMSKAPRGSYHKLAWDLASGCYAEFDDSNLKSLAKGELVGIFLEGQFSERPRIDRSGLLEREAVTYRPSGFEELEWTTPVRQPLVRDRSHINFIDPEVFDRDTYRGAEHGDPPDPRGLYEVLQGELLHFNLELLGAIGDALNPNPITLAWNHFDALRSNDEAKQTIRRWAEECGVPLGAT